VGTLTRLVRVYNVRLDGSLPEFKKRHPHIALAAGIGIAVIPENNVFDVIHKDCPAMYTFPDVGWGYHVFLNPLPAGSHVLHWTAKVNNGKSFQNITYNVTVEPEEQK
jgi:hypothetical protein